MKKYIKSTIESDGPALVYEIERESWKETFRTPENYFTHATRTAWVSTTGYNVFVLYKGAFYLVGVTGEHGTITTLEFVEITAEEAATIETEHAAQAMEEAREAEYKTAAAAIEYDHEAAAEYAQAARLAADYAKACATNAAKYHTSGTSDYAAECAYIAWLNANRATETAEQAAAEYAARALLDAYAETIGEYPTESDPETQAAYRVAAEDVAGSNIRATEDDRETVDEMVWIVARATRRPDLSKYEALEYLDLEPETAAYVIAVCDEHGTVTEDERHQSEAERTKAEAAYEAEGYEYANAATITDADGALVYIDYYEEPETREPYQRHELEAFLGDYANDYDVEAIEAEATEYDPATGRTVWTPEAVRDLWEICERHELVSYYPAAV